MFGPSLHMLTVGAGFKQNLVALLLARGDKSSKYQAPQPTHCSKELLEGCLRLRGPANAIDVATLQHLDRPVRAQIVQGETCFFLYPTVFAAHK